MEHPEALLRRLKLGREEYCQRLLTMLILEVAYPRWNTRSRPSARGLTFLRALDELSFGEIRVSDDVDFVDELDLPRRHEEEKGCAPDYGVLGANRLWIIELKTEASSHRPAQIPAYFELGRHHFPESRLDLTYLTPPLKAAVGLDGDRSRFAHVLWQDVLPLVLSVWGHAEGVLADVRDGLQRAINSIGDPWPVWRERSLADDIGQAVGLAHQTSNDGHQRALEHSAGSLEEVQELRVRIRDELRAAGEVGVEPWTWNAHTSGGAPLTEVGRQTGYEIRFSRRT